MAFGAVYDACVLYPDSLRDLLVRLAQRRLFRAHVTDQILDEMVRAIVRQRPGLSVDRLTRTRELLVKAMPDCLVTNYEEFVDGIDLPDANDRHVVAAAVRCGAQVIVTNNLRDFPAATLSRYGIEAQSPDTFVGHLLELSPLGVTDAVREMSAAKRNPAMTPLEVVASLERTGLRDCGPIVRRWLDN